MLSFSKILNSLAIPAIILFSFSAIAQDVTALTPAPAPVILNSDKVAASTQPAPQEVPAAAVQQQAQPVTAQPVAAPVLNSDKIATGEVSKDEVANPVSFGEFSSDAKQAILIDFNSDTVLYEKNANEKMFPSSMTKVLTGYLVFDQIKKGHITLDTPYTVSERSWKTGGSQMFLKVGDRVSVGDLIQGVIVQSANDGCIALAEGISGSVEAFVEDMNSVAKFLGMQNTHFVNPDGLPTENHYTTAKDLSIIAKRLILDFPEYYHYYSQRDFTYGKITQHNRNKLLDIKDLGVDGMKTGYTEMGGYGIIATGVNNGRRLIAVVNGLESDKARMRSAEALLRYGYTNFKTVKLYDKFEDISKVRIWGGMEDYVALSPNKDIELLVSRRNYDGQNYKTEVAFKEPWMAPIKRGTHMANLLVRKPDGQVIQQFPLYASKDIDEAGFVKKLKQKVKFLLGRY